MPGPLGHRTGHVSRVPVPGDRRAAAVELRPATWQALAEIYRPVGERIGRIDAELDDTERDVLVRTMTEIVASFDAGRAGPAGKATPQEAGHVSP